MGPNRLVRGYGGRRGSGRAAASLLALVAIFAIGCGRGGDGAETDPEKGSDAELLNAALGRELTALDAYTHGAPPLKGPLGAVGRRFRAQEQEYVDALTKAIRGLGGETDAEASDLDLSGIDGRADFLRLAYALESAALAAYLEQTPRLYTAAPRTLAASLAAAHAQHLVVLRQGLGASPAASVPEAFDGEVPPPGGVAPAGGG